MEHNGSRSNFVSNQFLVCQSWVLLFDLLQSQFNRILQNILQQDDASWTRWKLLTINRNQTEWDVLNIIWPLVTHFLQHGLQLHEVLTLLTTNDVQWLHEVVVLLTEDGSSQITRHVQSSTVSTLNHGNVQVVLIQVNNLCTLRFNQQAFFLQLVDNAVHLVVVESLSVEWVKLDIQCLVKLHEFLQWLFTEPRPQLTSFLITVFQLLKPSTTLIIQCWVFLSFFVETHVVLNQRVNWVSLNFSFWSPHLVGNHQLTELRTPVTQVVNLDWLVTVGLWNFSQWVSDNRWTQVTHWHWLSNVRWWHVDRYVSCFTIRVVTVFLVFQDSVQHIGTKVFLVQEEVNVRSGSFNLLKVWRIDCLSYFSCNLVRCHVAFLCQQECWKGKITHWWILRHFNLWQNRCFI